VSFRRAFRRGKPAQARHGSGRGRSASGPRAENHRTPAEPDLSARHSPRDRADGAWQGICPGSAGFRRPHDSSRYGVPPLHQDWYHGSMALNIKDPETERLAAQVAALTGDTKTGAVRYALRRVLESLSRPSAAQREDRLVRFLEEEIWPLIPPDQLGRPLPKAEREEILGFGEHGA
jgi:antitoxin VapB